ncbi:membrane protein [Lysobacter helvus]|uniref:Membrane protein n=2 Tax=Lysobacteraceae TaxID=32033 RepID=A0ABN6FR55_9GAMM|nr:MULTISPECIES: DUF2339 domain-containing protein [Lysobacter]BCT91380.1 membrane protein [Lysobacter caseinilyticus]BCT94533.1 membrane protein [Lysobacter helvus]
MESLIVLLLLAVLAVPVLLIVALLSLRELRGRVGTLERDLAQLRAEGAMPATATAPAARPRAEAVAPAPPPPRPAPVPPQPVAPTQAAPPQPAPQATPAPVPLRVPSPHVREPRPPGLPERAIEYIKHWFTVGNVPVKVGILVLFAGVAALLKFAADQGWLHAPIEVRLAGIAAAALAALVFAWCQRERNRIFALSLQGGAIGILLMTVFAAFKLYGLMPAGVAFGLSVVLIAGAGMLAVLQDAKALAFFAVLAGFLAPIWLSTNSGNHVALFSYYAVLNAAIFAIAWWKAWRVLNLLGFVFTFGIGTAWGVLQYNPDKFATTEPFLVLFFAFYLFIPLLFARKRPEGRRDFIDGCLVFGTPLVAFALQAGLLRGDRMPLAFCALGLAVIYAVLGALLRRRGGYAMLSDAYVLLAAGFATLAVPLALSARATASVFALEGAGLVWLGVRQSRRWPEWSGLALQALAAFAFLDAGNYRGPSDAPIANAIFMSALMICAGALASAWVYRNAGRRVSGALAYAWGLAWWVGNALLEIDAFVASVARADAWLAFTALTGWLAAEVHRRRPASGLAGTTLAALAVAAPIALAQADAHQQPFAGYGLWAWVLFAVLGVRSLVCLREGEHRVAAWAQFAWWLVWPFALSLGVSWLGERFQLADGWRIAGVALPWLAIAAIGMFRWPWLSAPMHERFDRLRMTLQATFFAILGVGFLLTLVEAGGSAPLPWIPVANPMELAQLAALVLAARWAYSTQAPQAVQAQRVPMVSVLGFVYITSVVLHAVHHWGGIAWNDGLIGTSLAQTSLTVVWSILGVVGWVLGSRRGQRVLWLAGAVLMAVVLVKLVIVDRSNLGNALGIASFIAFGLLCTVVGYLAPAPPRAPVPEGSA